MAWPPRALVLLCVVLSATTGVVAQQAVQVTDSGYATDPVRDAKLAGMVQGHQTLQFANARQRYAIAYNILEDPTGARPARRPDEGYIGMPLPAACNWYAGGFLDVVVNGRSLGATKVRRLGAAEQGERGSGDLLWVVPEGQVRLRFLLEPSTDYLACELALVPATPVKSLTISLRCFPSFFTAWHHRDGWRQIVGPRQTIEQGPRQSLDFANNPWLLYQDRVFDVAQNSADSAGPCAFAFLPEQVQTLTIDPGSYSVGTEVVLKPEAQSLRFAFWDFHQITNAAALAELRRDAPGVIAHLRQLDFSDRMVQAFDVTRERTALDGLLARSSAPDKFRPTCYPLFEKIAAGVAALKGGDMLAEQTVGDLIRQYRDLQWDLKIDALLND